MMPKKTGSILNSKDVEQEMKNMREAHADNMQHDKLMHGMTLLVLQVASNKDLRIIREGLVEAMRLQAKRDAAMAEYHRKELEVIDARLASGKEK
jgi:hypothetical protein